jgi:pimeloyl-ACP methyl ester carboxylesterase
MRANLIGILLCIGLLVPGAALAQEGDLTPAPPVPGWPLAAAVEAPDGLLLTGDLYLIDLARPTVILLHEMFTDRTSWGMLIDPLVWAGYNVLNIDLRGHGATGGSVNWWLAADQDIPLWITWLRETIGVRPDAISCLGSSMGSSIALEGCSLDPQTRTVIALSPGWRYHGVNVNAAFHEKFGARPVLLVYAKNDLWPSYGIPLMLDIATNPVTVHEFPGNAHGILLFDDYADELIALIIDWLNTYGA